MEKKDRRQYSQSGSGGVGLSTLKTRRQEPVTLLYVRTYVNLAFRKPRNGTIQNRGQEHLDRCTYQNEEFHAVRVGVRLVFVRLSLETVRSSMQ